MENISDIKKEASKIRRKSPKQIIRSPKRAACLADLKRSNIFQEINTMVKNGIPEGHVAEFIQEEKNELKTYDRDLLVRTIVDYRNSLSSVEVASNLIPKKFVSRIREFNTGMDVLKEMNDIYSVQRRRVDMAIENELEKGQLSHYTGREINLCMGILRAISDVQNSLGMTQQAMGTVGVDAHVLDIIDQRIKDHGVRRVLRNPESRRKMLEIAEHLSSAKPEVLEGVGRKLRAISGGKGSQE